MDELRKKGLEKMNEVYGWEMPDMPGDYFALTADHLFGTIWSRPGLSMRDKRLMRRLLQPKLGTRIAHRPKRGFEIPVDTWFREPAAEHLRTELTQGALVRDLGFNSREISALIQRHLSGQDVGRKLFALTALQRWAEHFA